MKTRKLTRQQQIFVNEYLVDLNASRAALRAGYSKNNHGVLGYQLLQNPLIQEHIAKRMNDLQKRVEITQDRVIAEYAKIAFSDIRNYYDENGDIKKINELTPDISGAIAAHEISNQRFGDCETVNNKIKLCDKLRALEAISKQLGFNT